MANAFASTSLTATLTLLKNWYQGPLVSQFNDELPLWREIEKGKEKAAGLQVVRALKVRRNPGIGATSDGGNLPTIGTQTTINATIGYKLNYLRFGVTAPMIKASQGDRAGFANVVEYEMEEGMKDLKADFNRQLFWDGTSDLAVVSANAVASNTITVTGRESAEDGAKFLDIGMVVDIYTAAGLPVQTGLGITNVTGQGTGTATLTLNSAVTTSSTDVVVRSNSFGNELQGILTSMDGATTSVYGVDRSQYYTYQGNVINANGNQFSLNLMQQTLNEPRRRGGGAIKVIYCDFDSERFLTRAYVADKRYIGAKVKGDGSFTDKEQSYLEFGGSPVIPDQSCPQRFFMLDPKTWKKYVLSELEWADETGAYFIAQSGVDAFEVRLRHFANLFVEKPTANAVLRNYVSN